jgi:hypothetical protein
VFPSLVCIRDMTRSWESNLIQKSIGIGRSSEPESSTVQVGWVQCSDLLVPATAYSVWTNSGSLEPL